MRICSSSKICFAAANPLAAFVGMGLSLGWPHFVPTRHHLMVRSSYGRAHVNQYPVAELRCRALHRLPSVVFFLCTGRCTQGSIGKAILSKPLARGFLPSKLPFVTSRTAGKTKTLQRGGPALSGKHQVKIAERVWMSAWVSCLPLAELGGGRNSYPKVPKTTGYCTKFVRLTS